MTAGKPEVWTILTTGAAPATIAKSARNPPATFLVTSSVMTISMTTASGATFPNTDMCGTPRASLPIGRRIATGIGSGSRHGDGPGWKTNPGALLHFTTDAGLKSAEAGAGFQVPWLCDLC